MCEHPFLHMVGNIYMSIIEVSYFQMHFQHTLAPNFKVLSQSEVISHDALRMRLRRLCEVKAKTKKCHVDEKTHQQWKNGGEGREWLEIALTEALDKIGPSQKNQHKKLRVS